MNLSQRIAALPPERFAKSAYLSADLAIKSAIRAGKEPPESAIFIKSQTPEQLMEQQRKRLKENNMREALEDLLWSYKVAFDSTAPDKYPQSDYLDGYRAFAKVAIEQIEEILAE